MRALRVLELFFTHHGRFVCELCPPYSACKIKVKFHVFFFLSLALKTLKPLLMFIFNFTGDMALPVLNVV